MTPALVEALHLASTALGVAFVGCSVALRSETALHERDMRLARVIAWLVGGYLAVGSLAGALPQASTLLHGRSVLAVLLVLAMIVWTLGTRHAVLRTRLRLGLLACAAILLVHELPLPWPASVRDQVDRVHPWPFAIAAVITTAFLAVRVSTRWLLDSPAIRQGVLAWICGWAAAAVVLRIADVAASTATAAVVVFAIGGAALALDLIPRSSKLPPAARETLPAVALLTDPEAVRRRVGEGLRSLFPGSAIEVFRLKGAPQSVLPQSREISRALAEAISRRGVILVDDAGSLPGSLAHELSAFGRGTVVPIIFDTLLFGVLHVDHAHPTTEMIIVARRFADLLGHRIETMRLGGELDAQRRVAALGAVAAAVVHDLRSPLSSVRLSLQVATAGEPRLAGDPGVALALAELSRVESMLGGLLDLGRPRGSARERVDVGDAARTAVERSTARARALGLRLELDPESSGAIVRGDSERLIRAVANLIDNALDASDANTTVRVRTAHDRGLACIEVIDRGHGEASALRERAAYTFSSDKPSGCGLGLLIVRDTAEAYGGRLDFLENEPRGVTARISLPAKDDV